MWWLVVSDYPWYTCNFIVYQCIEWLEFDAEGFYIECNTDAVSSLSLETGLLFNK